MPTPIKPRRKQRQQPLWLYWWAVVLAITVLILAGVKSLHARDLDGRYAQSPLREWFDRLERKGGGRCCSDADGVSVKDVDWDTKDGRYRVRLNGKWVDVPPESVVEVPNKFGPAVVWPVFDEDGKTVSYIRCFMPGAGT